MGNQCSSQKGRVMQPRTSRLGGAQEKFLLERRDRSTNEPPTPDTAGTGTLVDRRLLAAERLLGMHSACPCLQRMDTRSEFLIPRSFQRYASSIQIGFVRNDRSKRAGDHVVNRDICLDASSTLLAQRNGRSSRSRRGKPVELWDISRGTNVEWRERAGTP